MRSSVRARELTVLAMIAFALAVVWLAALAKERTEATRIAAAAATTMLLVGAWFVGARLCSISNATLVELQDELLRRHLEWQRDLMTLQEELAHELRNPLTSIKILLDLAAIDVRCRIDGFDVLQKEVCRMQQVIDDRLSFSRPLTPLVVGLTNTRALIGATVELHRRMARDKLLALDISGAESIEVQCDGDKLRQMLINLLLNAIDVSPAGGTIEVAATRDREHVRVSVLDRGPGLDGDLLIRAPEPGVSTKPNALGLGLTIVRLLATQHGGALHLRKREGGGLVAEIELPLVSPSARDGWRSTEAHACEPEDP